MSRVDHVTARPEISVVVPLYEEEDNVVPLVDEVRDALADGPAWELVLVDDGSSDETAERIMTCSRRDGRVRPVRLARNYGQAVAMRAGFDAARGEFIVSMDGDLQNDPADIPRVVGRLKEGYDLVAGYREGRWEGEYLRRKLPSLAANRLIRWITGAPFRDNGCSVKGFRRELLSELPLYAELHRFLGPIALWGAGARVTQISVASRPRQHGASKYGLSRAPRVLVDLLTVGLLRHARENPLRVFGGAGAACIGTSSGVFLFLLLPSVLAVLARPATADGPSLVFLTVTLLLLGLGLFLLMLGLIAELVVSGRRADGRVRARPAPGRVP